MVDEDVEIRPCRNGVSIVSKRNSHEDYYTAFGSLPIDRQISGEWKSRPDKGDTQGLFILTVNPGANYMYGYSTMQDPAGGVAYSTWILAKKTPSDEARIEKYLRQAEENLKRATIGLSVKSNAP